jgi:ABC-2 type transport system permease protein
LSTVWRIACEEWRLLRRDNVAVLGLVLLMLLTAMASFTSWEQWRVTQAEREHHQVDMEEQFKSQPDRHPHRMVHYGQFVFRPLNPLAAFDPGVDAYTGHTLFLEGHRQNSANFGDVRQSSALLRFGQLTPAFVLQVLAPLLLIFIGHSTLARERESGTLRVLLAQGVRPRQIVLGKLLAMGGVAALVLLPMLLALTWIAMTTAVPLSLIGVLVAGYALWLSIWMVGIVAVSTGFARGRDALVTLLAVWAVGVVLVPRLAPEVVASTLALPTRFEADIAVARDLAALGDSHNPNDPYFADFKKKVLERYGVSKVEDLPVSYKGLVGMEGERVTSALFERYAKESFDRQEEQTRRVDQVAWASPAIALRRLSMAAASTDLHGYRRFVEQAEQHRYRLVQELNRLQAEKFTPTTDRSTRDSRISSANWQGFADFHYEAEPVIQAWRRAAPAGGMLVVWLAALAGLLAVATSRLGRSAR